MFVVLCSVFKCCVLCRALYKCFVLLLLLLYCKAPHSSVFFGACFFWDMRHVALYSNRQLYFHFMRLCVSHRTSFCFYKINLEYFVFSLYTVNLLFHQSPTRHCGYKVTGQWQCTCCNCWQHSDWANNGSAVTVLPAVNNSDYKVTVQLKCVVGDWWNKSFAV